MFDILQPEWSTSFDSHKLNAVLQKPLNFGLQSIKIEMGSVIIPGSLLHQETYAKIEQ